MYEAVLCRAPDNAIDEQTLDALEALLDRVQAEPAVRVLVLRSDKALGFGVGIDLPAVLDTLEAGRPAGDFVRRAHGLLDRLDQLEVCTVGVLHGVVFGGALELALCLDTLLAEDSARFALPELRLGLVPGLGGLARMRRRCGDGLGRELLMTGRSLSVRRALARGLVDQRVPRGEGRAAAMALATSLGGLDRAAIQAGKSVLAPPPSLDAECRALEARLAHPDTPNLIRQTLERSDPWTLLPPFPCSTPC